MSIRRGYTQIGTSRPNTPAPSVENAPLSFQDLPENVLDHAIIPALRDIDALYAVACTARKFHQAAVRTAVSNDLTNIAHGFKLLEPEPPEGEARFISPTANSAARTASAALHALSHILEFVNLREGVHGAAQGQCSAPVTLAAANAIIRDSVHTTLAGKPVASLLFQNAELSRKFVDNASLFFGKIIDVLNKELEPWVMQELDAGGVPNSARHEILKAIYKKDKSLFLTEKNLTSLPELHEYLPHLTQLSLKNNAFSSIPETVQRLARLSAIDLNYNPITSLDLAPHQINQLKSLLIRNTLISTYNSDIWNFSNLEVLDITHTGSIRLPASIKNLVNLKSLYAGSNHLSMLPAELWELPELEKLCLVKNFLFASQIHAYKLPKLKYLLLGDNETLGSLPPLIETMRNLEYLSVYNCGITEFFVDTSNLKALKELYISNNALTRWPSSLQHLTALEKLDTSSNFNLPFQKKGMRALLGKSARGLNSVLTGSPHPSTDLSFSPSLKDVNLGGWNHRLFPVKLCNVKGLTRLNISWSAIVDLPPEIKQLENLENLDISNTKITYLRPEVGQLKHLKVLNLSHTQIASPPVFLINLQSLKEIDLSNTKITSIPEWFCQLASLKLIRCRGWNSAQLATGIPAQLRERENLIIL